jgi:hypothetical protein
MKSGDFDDRAGERSETRDVQHGEVMKKCFLSFAQGLTVGLILFPAMFYIYAASGTAPIKTDAAPLPLEHFFAKTVLHAQMDKEFPREVPIASDLNTWTAGAIVYRDNCLVCQGRPTGVSAIIGRGMFPPAPQLLVGKDMITDDPPGENVLESKKRYSINRHACIRQFSYRQRVVAGERHAGVR